MAKKKKAAKKKAPVKKAPAKKKPAAKPAAKKAPEKKSAVAELPSEAVPGAVLGRLDVPGRCAVEGKVIGRMDVAPGNAPDPQVVSAYYLTATHHVYKIKAEYRKQVGAKKVMIKRIDRVVDVQNRA